MLMWFSLSVVYYGIMYILPTTLIKMHGTEKMAEEILEDEFVEQGDKASDFGGIAATTLIEVPSAILVMVLIENKKIGRKNFMTIAYGMSALFCICVFFVSEANNFFFFLVSGAKVKIIYFYLYLYLCIVVYWILFCGYISFYGRNIFY